MMVIVCFITAEKGEVATAKGDGEKKECTTECKSRRRRDEKAPWALNYGSGVVTFSSYDDHFVVY